MTATAQLTHLRALPARLSRRALAGCVVAGWVILFAILRGRDTLSLGQSETTGLHQRLNDLNASVGANRNSNPVFVYFFNEIRNAADTFVTWMQELLSQPANGRPLPLIGWLGVIALIIFAAAAYGTWKVAVLAGVGFLFIGLQGLWQPAMDTLALTIAAVMVSLAAGIPIGIWAGMSRRFNQILTPVLDFMQIMPTFVYLLPLTLLFLIGPATGVIAMVIYAMPPVIRLTAHGIRGVPRQTLEAADSLGSTRAQALVKVMLPMARRTIVIGVNQTILAALSMVTIAALVGAPGLGQVVVQALESQDVGTAFNSGLALVVMALVFDRTTTAASERVRSTVGPTSSSRRRLRRILTGVGALITAIAVYVSYTYELAAQFPSALTIGSSRLGLNLGTHIINAATSVYTYFKDNLYGVTDAIKNFVTSHAINPLQSLLDNSPWWLTFAAIVALAAIIGGLRACLTAAACLALIVATGLWQDSMDTLAATLVATVVVMALGIAVGVWMGRSRRADRLIRPFLDAAQVMPAFVYLVPFVALFSATRFTGVVAAVVYAAPVAIKIVADGIRGVSPVTVEAATSAGSSTWQIITKVQLPMSVRTLALATNQGLIFVLAMVVVSGLVGGGALGFDVVNGFSQLTFYGKGLAAGVAIVLLGILLDRITQAAARRADASTHAVGGQ